MLEQTYTPQEVAESLGISRRKVVGWIRRGELKAVNVSNGPNPCHRIKLSDLASFEELRSTRKSPNKRKSRPQQTPREYI